MALYNGQGGSRIQSVLFGTTPTVYTQGTAEKKRIINNAVSITDYDAYKIRFLFSDKSLTYIWETGLCSLDSYKALIATSPSQATIDGGNISIPTIQNSRIVPVYNNYQHQIDIFANTTMAGLIAELWLYKF